MLVALAKQTGKRRRLLTRQGTKEQEEKADSELEQNKSLRGKKEGCGIQYYCKKLHTILHFIDGLHINKMSPETPSESLL